ncbi:TPA: hypothetical protein N2G31_001453 [Salmonella enterica]|nr:hypothetical protein [Salmonella enterica]
MTTITREQLHERARRKVKELEFAITQSAFTPIRDGLNEELELARIALASMVAKPVAWECGENIILFNPDTVEAYAKRAEISPKPLYAAPPAPVVPEEIPKGLAGQIVSLLVHNIGDKFLAQKIWNACRTAMLQAGNSPVAPDDSEHCPCCGKKLRRTCSVEGCGGKHVAHGLCQKHYDMKRWEDPEQVKKFREANKRFRDKKKSGAAAPQQEVKSALEHGMQRYAGAMQKLSEGDK